MAMSDTLLMKRENKMSYEKTFHLNSSMVAWPAGASVKTLTVEELEEREIKTRMTKLQCYLERSRINETLWDDPSDKTEYIKRGIEPLSLTDYGAIPDITNAVVIKPLWGVQFEEPSSVTRYIKTTV